MSRRNKVQCYLNFSNCFKLVKKIYFMNKSANNSNLHMYAYALHNVATIAQATIFYRYWTAQTFLVGLQSSPNNTNCCIRLAVNITYHKN